MHFCDNFICLLIFILGSSTTRENWGHKLKDQILHYLEKYIKRDNSLEWDQEIADQIFEERLSVLKEFLWYLEDKNIINPKNLNDSTEIKKLVSGLIKIDLSKIPKANIGEAQKKSINTDNYISTRKNKPLHSKSEIKFAKDKYDSQSRQANAKSNDNNDDKENNPVNENKIKISKLKNFDYNMIIKSNLVVNNQSNLMKFKPWTNEVSEYDGKKSKKGHNRNYSTGSIFHLKEVDWNQIVSQKVQNSKLTNYHENKTTEHDQQTNEKSNNYYSEGDFHRRHESQYNYVDNMRLKGRITILSNYLEDNDYNSVELQEGVHIKIKHQHHNSLSNCPEEVQKPIISISKNINNIKMIPAPVFQQKEEK